MEFEKVKELLKEAIDEGNTVAEIMQITTDKIYQQGLDDGRKPKKGTWEVKIRRHHYPDGREYKKFRCSACGNYVDDHEDSDFCPWCGADMRKDGEQDTVDETQIRSSGGDYADNPTLDYAT